MESTAPFALIGGSGFTSEAAVVAPSILIDDLELHPVEDEQPKLPMVPAPDADGNRSAVLRLLSRYVFREILTSSVLGLSSRRSSSSCRRPISSSRCWSAAIPSPNTILLLFAYTFPRCCR